MDQAQHQTFLTLNAAADYLKSKGIPVKNTSLRSAAEPDAKGRRKLPFFKDPLSGKLIIDRDDLDRIYSHAQGQGA